MCQLSRSRLDPIAGCSVTCFPYCNTDRADQVYLYHPQLPNITLNPTLDGIQEAINTTAKAILQVSTMPGIWR